MNELCVLLSYFYLRDYAKISAVRLPPTAKVFVDSGAFSAHSLGERILFADYVSWLKANPEVGLYASFDVIGDGKKTRRNESIMKSSGLAPIGVYHVTSPISDFQELVDNGTERIAVGGMVPYLKRAPVDLRKQRDRVFAKRPKGLYVHGFGVGPTELAFDYPWSSCDASIAPLCLRQRLCFEYVPRTRRIERFPSGSWSYRNAQRRCAEKLGVAWRDFSAFDKAGDVLRMTSLIEEVASFVTDVRATGRAFDFYFAINPGSVEPNARVALAWAAYQKRHGLG